MGAHPGLVAQWRREAEQKRHEARLAVDRDDFALAALLHADADRLLARADAVADRVPTWAVAS
jgi:hypothetical protein